MVLTYLVGYGLVVRFSVRVHDVIGVQEELVSAGMLIFVFPWHAACQRWKSEQVPLIDDPLRVVLVHT